MEICAYPEAIWRHFTNIQRLEEKVERMEENKTHEVSCWVWDQMKFELSHEHRATLHTHRVGA